MRGMSGIVREIVPKLNEWGRSQARAVIAGADRQARAVIAGVKDEKNSNTDYCDVSNSDDRVCTNGAAQGWRQI